MERMDGDKASWILEFVLRQPLEDWLAKEILFRLAAPPFLDPHLKKALFLRQLSSDLSAGRFTEGTLLSLELLEELDRSLGATVTCDALKTAYCAVAAELTASPLRARGLAAADFRKAVDRIWNCRVADMERSEARGLVGEDLREWKTVVVDAIASDELKGRILQRDTLREASRALRAYLNFVVKDMGPPLLEQIAGELARSSNVVSKDSTGALNSTEVATERAKSVEVSEVNLQETDVLAAPRKNGTDSVLPNPETEREEGRKPDEASQRQDHSDKNWASGMEILSPPMEAEVVKEALKSSCIDLQRVVRDPLPEALLKAVEIHSALMDARANQDDPGLDNNARISPTKDTRLRGPSLMERNPTARTDEWSEDSIGSISEKSAYSSGRLRLPSPRITRVSPLTLQKEVKFVRRRKMKKWTREEENVLRKAVDKYGTGRWKFILQCHAEIFEDRTEVDLKDKWRNLSRYHL